VSAIFHKGSEDVDIIAWAQSAVATANTLERLLGLAEVFKLDKRDNHEYTAHPDFELVRKAWADRYTELGGNIKSSDVKDPSAFLDTMLGKNAHGVVLQRFASRGVLVQEPSTTTIKKPSPAAKRRPVQSRSIFGSE
jgi:hypothetical protein